LAAGLAVLLVLALITYSTTNEAWPWFQEEGLGIFANNWDPAHGDFGVGALLYGTFLVSGLALLISVPISIGIALFITEVSPRRMRRLIVYIIDLLAAIPSVVYGLWALLVLAPNLVDPFESLSDATSSIPILKTIFADPSRSGLSFATAGIIVAIMITPIITSIIREVYATCPASQKEAALAMGATRWEMIRGAVFPHARSGTVAAVMIGFGRAVGETIAVTLIVGSSVQLTAHVLGPGQTLAGIIPLNFGEATGTQRAALIGMGVVLFVATVMIGIVARAVVARTERRQAGTA
jgi:phosphate transport system permease protein